MSQSFVHLHVHTEFSLLDGCIRIPDLLKKAKSWGMPAVAITDHGSMFGALDFYKRAKGEGVKPIIGCELYLAPNSRFNREDKHFPHHLTVLAKNAVGYKNLLALSSLGYLEGHHYRPRVDMELLNKHSEGLIALSGCLKGVVPTYITAGREELAREKINEFKRIFGEDNFFLEIMESGSEEQNLVNAKLLEMSEQTGVGLVATNDCHYLEPEDREAQDVMMCIQTGKTINEDERMKFTVDTLHFCSPKEMSKLFSYCPQAVENTLTIADRCSLEIPLGNFYLPHFKTDDSFDGDANALLQKMATEGLEGKKAILLRNNPTADIAMYEKRMSDEMEMIEKMGFAGYFLIVSDFVNYAHRHNIPVGPGRGSAAGALVAYCLGITSIDPIKYNLLFERFLNPARKTMPDIDMDFCPERREEIINYVADKYGRGNVAQIITFGTLGARAAIRDVGRVLGLPYGEVDAIAKLIPSKLKITIEEAIKEEPRLREAIKKGPHIGRLVKIARAVEGLSRHASIHAAGVVISDIPLMERVPLYKSPKDGSIATQYPMFDIEAVGLLKFDFLGLKTLTLLKETVDLIAANKNIAIDINALPLDDEKTFQLLQSGDTAGLFQLESDGMKRLFVEAKPDRFEDIIALIALYRPGPMDMIPDFLKRKHGAEKIKYITPDMEDILKETYGIMLYQEQVMQIASVIGGFSLADADNLRRMMSKKETEKMNKERPKFIEGAKERGISAAKAASVWEQMEKFAEYGFNKSHSAAYAMISFQTAYLKAHYPLEFSASLLSGEIHNRDKIVKYLGYYRSKGVNILPPDVNESGASFSVSGDSVRFGLSAIKNVGKGVVDAIVNTRKKGGRFGNFFDFAERVDGKKINKKVIESLIMSGAFDSLEANRALLLDSGGEVFDYIQKEAENRFQSNLFGDPEPGNANNYSFLLDKNSRSDWERKERLDREKEVLGFYLSGHPLDDFSEMLALATNTDVTGFDSKKEGDEVCFGCIINNIKTVKTRNGAEMAYLTAEDLGGFAEVIVFQDTFGKARDIVGRGEPLLVKGTLEVTEEEEGRRVRVIAQDIQLLAKVKFNPKKIKIAFNSTSSDDTVEALLEVLKREGEGGEQEALVGFWAHEYEVTINLGKKFTITPRLKDLLTEASGDGSVVVL